MLFWRTAMGGGLFCGGDGGVVEWLVWRLEDEQQQTRGGEWWGAE